MEFPQIKLLSGTHENTAQTGHGCFMNVIAYLNNEPVITDQSECVCFVVRPIAIWLNDYCDEVQRARLLPFILRAMGSRTNYQPEIGKRVWLAVNFANIQKDLAASAAKSAKYAAAKSAKYAAAKSAKYAEYAAAKSAEYAEYAAKSAEYAAEYAAKYAAEYAAKYAAKSAAKSAEYAESAAMKERIIQAGFDFFDAALPPLDCIGENVQKRIEKLVELNVA